MIEISKLLDLNFLAKANFSNVPFFFDIPCIYHQSDLSLQGVSTSMPKEAFKALTAPKYVKDGWVQLFRHRWVEDTFIAMAKVAPSMKHSKDSYTPWVAIHKSLEIRHVHCNCIAGSVYYLIRVL